VKIRTIDIIRGLLAGIGLTLFAVWYAIVLSGGLK